MHTQRGRCDVVVECTTASCFWIADCISHCNALGSKVWHAFECVAIIQYTVKCVAVIQYTVACVAIMQYNVEDVAFIQYSVACVAVIYSAAFFKIK